MAAAGSRVRQYGPDAALAGAPAEQPAISAAPPTYSRSCRRLALP